MAVALPGHAAARRVVQFAIDLGVSFSSARSSPSRHACKSSVVSCPVGSVIEQPRTEDTIELSPDTRERGTSFLATLTGGNYFLPYVTGLARSFR